MNQILIGIDLSDEQINKLKGVIGNKYNLAEILSAWCARQIDLLPDATYVLKTLPSDELDNLEFEEFVVDLTPELRLQLEKSSSKRLDDILFGCIKELTGNDPRNEPLSQYQIDDLLADLNPPSGHYGPNGLFHFDRLFVGSGSAVQLVGIRIQTRSKILKRIRALSNDMGFSKVEEFFQDRIQQASRF